MKKIAITFTKFLVRYRLRFGGFLVAITVYGIADALPPYFYKLFIDALPGRDYSALLKLLGLYIGLRVVNLLMDIITYTLGDSVLIPAASDARKAVFKKIQDLDFAYHVQKNTGSLISIFKRGDNAFFNLFHNFNVMYRISIQLIVMLVIFGAIDLRISTLMIVSFVISMIAAKFLLVLNIKRRKEFTDEEDNISGVIVDNLINYETVKYFAKEDREQERLTKVFVPWAKKLWSYANTFRLIDIVIGSISITGLILVLVVSLRLYIASALTLAEFVLIMGFVGSFYYRFFDMVYRFRETAKNYSDISDYFSILDNETLVKDPKRAVKKSSVKGEIRFNNISFSYGGGKVRALDKFSLTIREGQSVALVGKSGVGKTTIVKLLLRFFDVDKGKILIDGINIKRFRKDQLRSFMGVVPQEPIMFNNTIGFNIGYGAENPGKKQIVAAARMAYLHDFIVSLPDQYETNVGERGVKLSGGQKQRLAIARMILSNPDIIVFDEATSQLDSESEKYIQEAFWKAARNKTTIIIAHRLSTVVRADKIVVMEEGKIAEIGSHRELVAKKGGLYKKYWDLQVDVIE